MDRLSALSDDLLRRILYLVPSKEAASTSVLSRRWGSLWRSSGAVNLAVRAIKENYVYHQSPSARIKADEAFFSRQEAFARAAAAALAAAEAPVTRLTLRVDTGGDYCTISQILHRGRGWTTDVDVVGSVLSHHKARHVEDLRITLADASDASDAWDFLDKKIGQSPGIYSLVSLACWETLRVLDLTKCDLAPLALPRLATLRLRRCSVNPEDLQAMVDAAPELATVHLDSVFFKFAPPVVQYGGGFGHPLSAPGTEPQPLALSFRAATTLVLAWCGGDDQHHHRSDRWAIEIDAPRLQSLVYKGQLRRFLLTSPAPDLARVDLHFRNQQHCQLGERTRVLFWQFMHNFTNARALKLKLDHDIKEIAAAGKARRAALLHAFPGVERLELEGVHRPASKTAAVAVANLLHCCPAVRDLTLRLSTVPPLARKQSLYWRPFLGRKDHSDYTKSIDRFSHRRSKTTAIGMAMEESSGGRYDDVPDGIPGLSGRSFACLQSSLRRVSLQFRLGDPSSSCLGVRLLKFFAENAVALEEIRVDSGNRRLHEHLNLGVGRWIAPNNPAKACFEHRNLAEGSWEFTRVPSAPLDSTADLGRGATGFTVLPLQRRARMDCKS